MSPSRWGRALLAVGLVLGAGPALGADGPTGFARPLEVPFPAANPYTEAKARLGERLFFEPALSGAGDRSCATCHAPATGWADPQPRSAGLDGKPLGRRTPFVTDAAWGERYFWDGRAADLEEQALGPVQNPLEMNQTLDGMVAALTAKAEYAPLFAAAFPEEPRITAGNVANAIATFERTVVGGETPFDRWTRGDADAVSEEAKRGFALFTGKAGCASCHSGWGFTDHGFHDIGLPGTDRGRGATLGLPELDHAFKTPSLREVGRHAPYMHDGSLATLEAVLEHYAGGAVQRPTLSPDLPPLTLTAAEKAELLAFLRTLDAPEPAAARPPKVEAKLVVAAVAETKVGQKGKRFSERHLRLSRGQALTVLNDDTREHNVRYSAEDGREFNSGVQEPGQSVSVPFAADGTYHVYCGIHPKMKLTVEVGR